MSGDGHWLISTRDPALCSSCARPLVEQTHTSAGPMRWCALHYAVSILRRQQAELHIAHKRLPRPLTAEVNGIVAHLDRLGSTTRRAAESLDAWLDADPETLVGFESIRQQRADDEAGHAAYMKERKR